MTAAIGHNGPPDCQPFEVSCIQLAIHDVRYAVLECDWTRLKVAHIRGAIRHLSIAFTHARKSNNRRAMQCIARMRNWLRAYIRKIEGAL
jgi:hypothetical protein